MDFIEFENIISKIDGVINVKIISNSTIENSDTQEIKELHILASNIKSPKQIVRDVESSLIAAFDYKIDRRVISVAQIQTDELEPIRRILFDGVAISTSGNSTSCEVRLKYDGQVYSAQDSGIKTTTSMRKSAAQGTIKSIEGILKQSDLFYVQDVNVEKRGDVTFASVIISMIINDKEELMIGSVIVKNDIYEAIAKATLDAVNRRVSRNDF